MSNLLYFAYGSNLDADQMRERCPNSRILFRARLLHHRLDFTHYSTRWSGGAADIVPEDGGLVWGVIYTQVDLVRLDRFEGGYERVSLEVLDDDDRLHDAVSYSVREKGQFAPGDAYLEQLLHWAQRWEFPEAYLSQLPASTRSRPKPR